MLFYIVIISYIVFGLWVLHDTDSDFQRIAERIDEGDKWLLLFFRFLAVVCWFPIAVIGSIVVIFLKLRGKK